MTITFRPPWVEKYPRDRGESIGSGWRRERHKLYLWSFDRCWCRCTVDSVCSPRLARTPGVSSRYCYCCPVDSRSTSLLYSILRSPAKIQRYTVNNTVARARLILCKRRWIESNLRRFCRHHWRRRNCDRKCHWADRSVNNFPRISWTISALCCCLAPRPWTCASSSRLGKRYRCSPAFSCKIISQYLVTVPAQYTVQQVAYLIILLVIGSTPVGVLTVALQA